MDCSKTINFFDEAKRLCDSRPACEADAANKEQCPLRGFCGLPFSEICAEKAVENLQKWSDEHPKKTYAQDFFEKFPKARSNSDGTPFVCRERIYGGKCPVLKCDECWNKECWNEPMEDE